MPKVEKKKKIKVEDSIGYSGIEAWKSGEIQDPNEYLSDFDDLEKRIPLINKMVKGDSTVNYALDCIYQIILSAKKDIVAPEDATPQEIEVRDFVYAALFENMEHTFESYLRQLLDYIAYGFSVFEPILGFDSKSRLIIKRLDERLQSTVRYFKANEDGTLKGIEQFVEAGLNAGTYFIPVEKLVIYTNNKVGNDPRGVTALRSIYKNWYFKDKFYKFDASAAERAAVPTTIMTVTPNASSVDKAQAKEVGKNIRAHHQGVVVKSENITVEYLDYKAGNLKNLDASINHHDIKILSNFFLQFLALGSTGGGGSYALDKSQQSFLLFIAKSYVNYIDATTQQQVIDRYLIEPNFVLEPDRYPQFKISEIFAPDISKLAEAYQKLQGFITVDDDTEAHVRDLIDFPPKNMEQAEQIKQEEKEKEEKIEKEKAEMEKAQQDGEIPIGQEEEKEEGKEFPFNASDCGHDHSKKRARFEPDNIYWRPLSDYEKHINLKEIEAKQDDARDNILYLLDENIKMIVDELVADGMGVIRSGDIRGIRKIKVDNELKFQTTLQIRAFLKDMYKSGRVDVDKELIKLKRIGNMKNLKDLTKPIYDPVNINEQIAERAKLMTETPVNRIVNSTKNEIVSHIDDPLYTGEMLGATLTGLSTKTFAKEVNLGIRKVYAFGRAQGAEDNAGDVEKVVYSAILDQNTCDVCADEDGNEYDINGPEYQTTVDFPNPYCEGGMAMCRCFWIYVPKGL